MKPAKAALVCLWLCSLVVLITAESDLRLIETAPGERQWMTQDDVEMTLIKPGKINHFFDVTDHLDMLPIKGLAAKIPAKPSQQKVVEPLLPELKVEELRTSIEELSAFFNRYYAAQYGKDAAVFIHDKYAKYAENHPNAEVTYFEHPWIQPSVIGRIKGQGPLADEIVILGGHEDSIAGGATSRAPGADDDASGTSTALEVFRVLTKNKFQPDRTLEFHAYAAEEVGLRGSQAIADSYRRQGIKVAGMMQLDMTCYTRPGILPVVGLMHDFVNLTLTKFIGEVINTYANIGWVETRCGYACSDHASWTRAGYPSCLPAEGRFADSNPNIHTARDTLDKLSLEHGIEYAKIGLAFLVELGLAPPSK